MSTSRFGPVIKTQVLQKIERYVTNCGVFSDFTTNDRWLWQTTLEGLLEWRACLGTRWQTQWSSKPLNDTFIIDGDGQQILDELLPRFTSVLKSMLTSLMVSSAYTMTDGDMIIETRGVLQCIASSHFYICNSFDFRVHGISTGLVYCVKSYHEY